MKEFRSDIAVFLLMSLGCLFTVPCEGQGFKLNNYTTLHGLSSDAVWCIAQDNEGYIWIGTSAGLDRFDGKDFVHFGKENGLPENEILEIFPDSTNDRLILQTFGSSMSFVEDNKIYNEKTFPALVQFKSILTQSRLTYDAINDKRSIVYTDLDCYEINKSTFEIQNVFKYTKFYDVFKIFYRGKDVYKLCSNPKLSLQLMKLDSNKTFKLVEKWDQLYLPKLKLRSRKQKKSIIFDYKHDIYVFDENTLKLTFLKKAKTEISAVLVDNDSLLWYGKNDGLWVIDLKDKKDSAKQLISGSIVSNILEDRSKNIWISTIDRGLFLINNKDVLGFEMITNNYKNPANHISKLNSRLIIGHSNSDFSVYSSGNFTKTFYDKNDIKFNRTIASFNLGKQLYLVNEFAIYNANNNKICYKSVAIKDVKVLNDSILLVASVHGLKKLKKVNDTFIVTDTLYDKRLSSFAFLNNRIVIAGDLEGVIKIDIINKLHRRLAFPATDKKYKIKKIYQDARKFVWILTADDGIWVVVNNTLFKVLNSKFIKKNSLYCALFDSDSTAWIGTNKGMLKIIYENNFHIREEYLLDENYGLVSNQVFDIKKFNDTLWVGTNKGISFFPVNTDLYTKSLSLCYTNLFLPDTIFSRKHFPKILEPFQNSFRVGFNTFTYVNSPHISYIYSLSQLSDNWQTTKENTIEFSGLPPGKYTLKMYAADDNNRVKKSKIIYWSFEIEPKFYQTIWFIILSLITSIFLILFFAWFFNRTRARSYLAKRDLEGRIHNMELKALRSQLNPHFIFNALNSIKDFLQKKDIKITQGYLEEFAQLMRFTLDQSRKTQTLLSDELNYLNSYLNLEKIRFESKFDFSITVLKINDPKTVSLPSMMIQPFLENAVKHGKIGKLNYPGFVSLQIEKMTETILICIIKDNGVGLFSEPDPEDKPHFGSAIQIEKERIYLFNKLYHQHITFHISERDDGNPGTQVILHLPIL